MGTDELLGKPNKLWESKITPNRFMIQWDLRLHGFMASWLHSFMASWLHGFMPSFILRKRESKNVHLLVFKEFMNSSGIQFLEQKQPSFLCTERKQKEKNGKAVELLIV